MAVYIERGFEIPPIPTVELSPQAQAFRKKLVENGSTAGSSNGSTVSDIHIPPELKNHPVEETPGIWGKIASFFQPGESPHSKIPSGFVASEADPALDRFNPPQK